LGTSAAFLTAFYSIRLIFLTFLSGVNSFKPVILGAQDSSLPIAFPLFILTLPTIFLGYSLKDLLIGVGSGF